MGGAARSLLSVYNEDGRRARARAASSYEAWTTSGISGLSQRQLQDLAGDCDDPSDGCVAYVPSYWCRSFLECSPTYLYTWQCRGWFCGWCSWKWDQATMCESHRSLFCN